MREASFDSNILIDALRGNEKALAELERVDRRWISRVTWIEVMSGVEPEDSKRARAFFGDFQIEELTAEIAAQAASLRRERRRLKLADAVILATAQMRGRILVTRNTKDFPAAMPGIRVPYNTPSES